MSFFTCPICKKRFIRQNHSLVCPNGHCFDIARQGYVNLLRSRGAARRHGDDKMMVAARTAFLNAGCYDPLRDAVTELAARHAKGGCVILDAGCGEGFYPSFSEQLLKIRGFPSPFTASTSPETPSSPAPRATAGSALPRPAYPIFPWKTKASISYSTFSHLTTPRNLQGY